jgi:hypothetical protein
VTSDDGSPPSQPIRRPNVVRDIGLSLGVLVVPLLLLIAFCRPTESALPTVDSDRIYQAAKTEAKFPVRVPSGLPAGWRATNGALNRLDGGALTVRVSYLTPGDRFVQLVQSDADSEDLIVDELGAGKIQGTNEIRGEQWQRYSGRRAGETALVRLGPESTVLATGDATVNELIALASALR